MNPAISMGVYLLLIGILTTIAIVIYASFHHIYLYFDRREQLINHIRDSARHEISNPASMGLRGIYVEGVGDEKRKVFDSLNDKNIGRESVIVAINRNDGINDDDDGGL